MHWDARIAELEAQLAVATDEFERDELMGTLDYMRGTDMAVVVSQSQNEVEDLAKRGLNIAPHRKRMLTEDMVAGLVNALYRSVQPEVTRSPRTTLNQ